VRVDLIKNIDIEKDEELRKILEAGAVSIGWFCYYFLPDNFNIPDSSQHKKINEIIDKRYEKTVICATRGLGKTTKARAIAAQAICYCDANFIVYVSESATLAEMQTENLKKDLLSSVEIREVFGDIRINDDHSMDDSFSRKAWIANIAGHQTLVLPRGSGQQVGGLIHKTVYGNFRPDLILVDDLEERETIDNPDQRAKRKLWFFGALMNCFDRSNPNKRVLYIDTLKHEDALIVELLEANDWKGITIPVCDENYKSLAPDFMSDEMILKEVRSYQDKKIMDVFAQEIMCMPISKKDASFKRDYLRYYDESDEDFIKNQKPFLVNIVIIDPAKSVKQHSDESGFVVWGFNPFNERMYLRYAAGEKLHPDEIYSRGVDLVQQYNAPAIGIEETGLNEFVTYPLQNELIRRKLMGVELVPLQARSGRGEFAGYLGGKKARIGSMVGYYRQGLVYHNRVGTGAYELQLMGFPKSKRWDIMDAAAYINEILMKGDQFYWLRGGKGFENDEYMEKKERELDLIDATVMREIGNKLEYDDEDWRTAP